MSAAPPTASAKASNVSWEKDVSVDGAYKRKDAEFRSWISAEPDAEFPAAAGRYHFYVSYACPWASRCLAMIKHKGLDDVFTVDVVDTFLPSSGWTLTAEDVGSTVDTVHGRTQVAEIYKAANPEYTGRYTVPILFDKETDTIVNNESSEIIVMLNSAFNAFCATPEHAALDLYPEALRGEIDAINERVYTDVNNGVYKCGFATTQAAYDAAFAALFDTLEWMEDKLTTSRFLAGPTYTLADVRAFVTLVRFDHVYVSHFKCNKTMIRNMPALWAYTREIYQMPGIADTVFMDHICKHYYGSHTNINPLAIIAHGPNVADLATPHGRDTTAWTH